MVTTVGTETSIEKLVENLILLEHDAIAAYDAVIERLENPDFAAQISAFREDHEAHLSGLRECAAEIGLVAPTEGDAKEFLTTGKVKLASLMGDGAILKAMSTNETDTVTAYSNAIENPQSSAKLMPLVERALADEQRHKDWMDRTAA
uniref:DUF2383 domain-containing protein n=1 Tax=Cereibacter sphaeroides (strain ATCC 17025 / ATH 2.4.3) TaxID=349102 RepID=A4X013_CERS5